MKIPIIFFVASLTIGIVAAAEPAKTAVRNVDVKSADGTILKGSFFAAKPGPGVLLFHQTNRRRESWEDIARQLVAAGINVLTVDTDPKTRKQWWPGGLDAAFEYLISQPGVKRDVIGIGGAGVIGVENSVETARRHSDQVKSLVLLSGETSRDGLQFLRQASQLPELFVFSDDDEYPPIQQAMGLLYVTASSPSRKLVHYSASKDAPWKWYEPFDIGKVPATGGHGTDLFKGHSELPSIIVDWFATTLIKTPGHAPADTLASASTINEIQTPGGVPKVTQQLTEARKKDSQAQLFPEITASTIGQGFLRAGDTKSAIDVLKLVLLAYPDSADANDNLAAAYLKDGQKDLARQHAEKALAILDARTVPASSWTDTQEYRGEIRRSAQKTLKKLSEEQG
ncbi:MAG: hypothetical protein DME85_00820 [Verrucomicrobia bacterium]|nr:MAG: hypothetical protein DME85_00820 [Verrucomicrobiota bacterium]